MKNFTKLRIALTVALIMGGIASAWAQNTVSTPEGDLYLNLRNVSSPGVDVATEDPDLVTTGTRVPYLVIPDPILNPNWAAAAAADATTTTGINSTWTWTIPGTIGSLNATPANNGHYIMLNVTGTATTTGTINVKEQSGASCPDPTGTNINLRVVAQPAASALAVSDGADVVTSICVNGTNGSLNVTIPTFTLTHTTDAIIPGLKGVRVSASLSFTNFVTGATSTIFPASELNVDASGVISTADMTTAATAAGNTFTDLDSWGTYTLTVTHISDKISRKDINAANGYFAVNGVTGYSATYSVLKTASTGAIYHLPNN